MGFAGVRLADEELEENSPNEKGVEIRRQMLSRADISIVFRLGFLFKEW
jgi:hypothetical protein